MSVRVDRLPNGLTVATHEMPHLESAALGVWVGAGSRSELPNEHGLAHLLEHMAFKGTTTRSAVAIAEEIEAVGGEVNAATSVETTSYYARVLKDDVPLGLDILSDILQNSVFDATELEREQHVIVQEIGAAHDTPDDRVYDLFLDQAFPDQPLGRAILGTEETVRAAGKTELTGYLDRHYRGPGMVISAAGAVNHDELVRLASEKFGRLATTPGPTPGPGRYRGGDGREMRDLQEAQILIGFPGRSYHSEDFHTAQVLSAALGGGMSSRLFQEVREKRGLCYSIFAFHWAFSDTGLFGIHAATGEEDVAELMPVILGELERAAGDITEAEIARSRAQMRAGLLMTLESPAGRAGQLARQILLYGRPLSFDELVEKVDAVSAEGVRKLAGKLISEGRPTVAGIGPVKALIDSSRVAERLGAPVMA